MNLYNSFMSSKLDEELLIENTYLKEWNEIS